MDINNSTTEKMKDKEEIIGKKKTIFISARMQWEMYFLKYMNTMSTYCQKKRESTNDLIQQMSAKPLSANAK